MSRLTRFSLVAVLLCAVSAALGACQALAGIEDRTFDGNDGGDTDAGTSAQCEKYCQLAQDVCGGENALYADDKTCKGICALLPPGQDIEPTGNTVACRVKQLEVAQQVTPGEPATLPDYCAKAGPGGNGTCGSNCESYCLLYAGACKENQPQLGTVQYDQDTCISKCEGLADKRTFDWMSDYEGDTLQCRLAHTSSATIDPAEHCVHAQLQAQAQAKPPGPCIDDPKKVMPDCTSYCQLEMTECQGDEKIYESLAQCKAVCNALPKGSVADIKENTVGCRKYHSYNALVDAPTHCPHTGPGGDGHCGSTDAPGPDKVTGNCESYCILLAAACDSSKPGLDAADSFQGKFASQAACQEACGEIDGAAPNSGYTLATLPEGDNLQCRLLHVSRALSDAINECSSALGGAPCN